MKSLLLAVSLIIGLPFPLPAGRRPNFVLASVIDIAPTVFELAGLAKAPAFQGRSLTPLDTDVTATVRPFAFSESNWHACESLGRSVRDGRWLSIRNHRPRFALPGPADSVGSPSFKAVLAAAGSSDHLIRSLRFKPISGPRPAPGTCRGADKINREGL